MGAREDILSTIRSRPAQATLRPGRYRRPAPWSDQIAQFSERAVAEAAEVHIVGRMDEVPQVVGGVLRGRNLPARIHLPSGCELAELSWNIEMGTTPPGPNDAAVSVAPFAIAETGTLVFLSGPAAPPSWHFRPGLEIAVIAAGNILPTLEDVLARIREHPLPSTVNLVTGPSRTGDIEQTIELGAHGPKTLSIVIVRD